MSWGEVWFVFSGSDEGDSFLPLLLPSGRSESEEYISEELR